MGISSTCPPAEAPFGGLTIDELMAMAKGTESDATIGSLLDGLLPRRSGISSSLSFSRGGRDAWLLMPLLLLAVVGGRSLNEEDFFIDDIDL